MVRLISNQSRLPFTYDKVFVMRMYIYIYIDKDRSQMKKNNHVIRIANKSKKTPHTVYRLVQSRNVLCKHIWKYKHAYSFDPVTFIFGFISQAYICKNFQNKEC